MAACKYLAKLLYESPNPEYILAHTFFVLDWNLVSRAEFVVDAKVDVVSSTEDALIFDMGTTKTASLADVLQQVEKYFQKL